METIEEMARQVRCLTIEGIYHARSGHPGGSLSIADILAVLYFDQMQVDPSDEKNPDRDRLVLSKGHACPALYAALALKGFFPVDEVKGLRKIDHFLEGHPHVDHPRGRCSFWLFGDGSFAGAWDGSCRALRKAELPHLCDSG